MSHSQSSNRGPSKTSAGDRTSSADLRLLLASGEVAHASSRLRISEALKQQNPELASLKQRGANSLMPTSMEFPLAMASTCSRPFNAGRGRICPAHVLDSSVALAESAFFNDLGLVVLSCSGSQSQARKASFAAVMLSRLALQSCSMSVKALEDQNREAAWG